MAVRELQKTRSNISIENFVSYFVDGNGKCNTCGHDHSFRPTFEGVKTSIDIIPKLLRSYKKFFEVA
jgi:hypothetical protein